MASFLIKDVRIFDGENTIDNGSVLVEDGKISEVSSGPVHFDGKTYSKPGHTLFPGMIDTHIHADSGNEVALPQSLRFGVTTVCDMANEWYNIQKLRKQRGGGDCADIKTTSFAATIEGGWPAPIVLMHADTPKVECLREVRTGRRRDFTDPYAKNRAEIATWPKLTDAHSGRQYVQDRLKEGVDYIKLMHESGTVMGQKFNKPTLELQRAVIEEAHKNDLVVVAHATCLSDTLEILDAGVDGLTHTFIDQAPTQELIQAYKKNNAHCNPTLACMGSGTTEGKATQEKYAHDPRVQHLLDSKSKESMCMCMQFAQASGSSCEHAFETVRQLKKADVMILIGSDAAGPAVGTAWGLTVHQELYLFVTQCGFTPGEALKAATALPAKRFSFTDRGLIKEGLRADMVLVEGNPLEEIDHTLNLRGVWSEGKLASTYEGLS